MCINLQFNYLFAAFAILHNKQQVEASLFFSFSSGPVAGFIEQQIIIMMDIELKSFLFLSTSLYVRKEWEKITEWANDSEWNVAVAFLI
jgi:hypothetical protein